MVNDGEVLVYERGICQNLHFDHRWYIIPSLKVQHTGSVRSASGNVEGDGWTSRVAWCPNYMAEWDEEKVEEPVIRKWHCPSGKF